MSGLNNPFAQPEAIDGGQTARDIAAVYEANRRSKPDASYEIGAVAMKDVIAAEAVQTRETPGLEVFQGLCEYEAFEDAFASSTKMFNRVGLIVPSPQEFIDAGVDFQRLAEFYTHMENPEIVIAPWGVVKDIWWDLYEALIKDKSILNHPLKGTGLAISDDARNRWEHFESQTLADSRSNEKEHQYMLDYRWSIRLISGQDTPPNKGELVRIMSKHPTINEYLALQARRIQDGKPPVDMSTTGDWSTWLAGNHNGASPFGLFDRGHVTIGTMPHSMVDEYMGIRTPQW